VVKRKEVGRERGTELTGNRYRSILRLIPCRSFQHYDIWDGDEPAV
jgi:hypothetical protein